MMTTTMSMMIQQPFFSSSFSYSSFSPFFTLQIKSKSFQMFNTPPPYLYLKNQLTFPLIIHHYPSPCCSLHLSTNNTSDSTSFAVSYLINTLNFSPNLASKLCSGYNICFQTAQNPDSVINFFRNHGFSDSQLLHIITKLPMLLSCDPCKRVLPKFQFLLSKGASKSDIVNLVSKCPRILAPSLENHIVPAYELLYRFMLSDEETIDLVIQTPYLLSSHHVSHNIKMLVDIGVKDSTIVRFLKRGKRSWLFQKNEMQKLAEELKNLGFNPSTTTFGIAMEAKLTVNKTLWKEKVDAFKKWGWSDEDVMKAFRSRPNCMLVSIDKINLLMSFWVDQLGWDVLALVKKPSIFSFSLEKTIIPRASVMQFLLKKGLRKKDASLTYPFKVTDKMFRDKFINRYEEESSYLLKLYEEKLTLAHTREDKTDMS